MAWLINSVHHLGGNDHNPLTMSDDQILEEIYSTNVQNHTKFDVDSLFTLVDNILKRSTHIVDNIVQGNNGSPEHIDDKIPQTSFTSPLCTLKKITSEMSCKPLGAEIAHKTTLAILKHLSSYSWEAKAVLTLAAFALEYGEFWLLSLHQPTEPLAKSLAVLKRVPMLTKPLALQKHRQAVLELNNLIMATHQVIELIFELEKLESFHLKDVPALELAMRQIPIDVYWAIITIVAIVTQIDCLATDSEERQDLSTFGQKINIILSKLRKQMSLRKQQIEEAEYYKTLGKLFKTPHEIMEALKMLIFWKDTPKAPIYDGDTKKMVSIEVLEKKNVFLLISTLDINVEEISAFHLIHKHKKCGNQYKIVWVPIVEEWSDKLHKKFELLKSNMSWYVLQHFEPINGFKFIKEEWQFKKKPMVVVINPQSQILHSNALHMIQVWGTDGFPFTKSKEIALTQEASWIEPLVINIDPHISTWMKEQKYIFFYGGNGNDKEWVEQFKKIVGALANDAAISIQLVCLDYTRPLEIISRFWIGIESLFVTKMHMTTNTTATQEVQKLLSYKNENGWVLLTKGSTVVLAGHQSTIVETLGAFDKWKHQVNKKGFEICFKEQHHNIVLKTHRCTQLQISNVAGKIPDTITCPEPGCHRTMEVFISYKCCHNTANA